MVRAVLRSSIVAAILSMTITASAQSSPADRLYVEADGLMKRGEFAAACDKLVESDRLEPTGETKLSIALCLEKQGKLVDAAEVVRGLLASLPQGHEKVGHVRDRLAAIEKRLGTIRIRGASPETIVEIDGVEVEDVGAPISVNPGKHEVVVNPGGRERRFEVDVGQGAQRTVSVASADAETAKPAKARDAPQARDAAEPGGGSRKTIGWISLGIGAVGLGGVVYIESQLAKDCPEKKCRDDVDLGERRTLDFVFLGVGVVGAGVGAYLLLSDDRGPEHATVIAPRVSTSGGGVSVARRF